MNKKLRIIYMGTPDFAVPTLQMLLTNQINVVAVITAPDRPAGRGRSIKKSAVKRFAESKGLPVLQPTNLKSPAFQEELRSFKADLQVVVAFRMLPQSVWDMPSLGTVNLHASLLPQYRGAAPINWVLINGEKTTGVTTFFIEHKIDTGKIIFQDSLAIGADETAGELHDKLMNRGAQLMVKTVEAIADGNYPQVAQEVDKELKQAPKLSKDTGKINWSASARDIHNLVRGLSPYPGAFTTLNKERFKVLKTALTDTKSTAKPGSLFKKQTELFVATSTFDLQILLCQPAGKRAMEGKAFANGLGPEPKPLA